uniref:Uncharacterized protein n=1 Tax=Kwoniella bestiolae CBS 10118 TaxID=1296100 RepID=A0A1B9G4T9_9TREE|nr:hypothetical protein I302_03734 [Kwoniella bestiolae CBS 10118]OCF26057.1 hypothetical protein I302_03734 [Kwoniella bestiolae CBS 10118]
MSAPLLVPRVIRYHHDHFVSDRLEDLAVQSQVNPSASLEELNEWLQVCNKMCYMDGVTDADDWEVQRFQSVILKRIANLRNDTPRTQDAPVAENTQSESDLRH